MCHYYWLHSLRPSSARAHTQDGRLPNKPTKPRERIFSCRRRIDAFSVWVLLVVLTAGRLIVLSIL